MIQQHKYYRFIAVTLMIQQRKYYRFISVNTAKLDIENVIFSHIYISWQFIISCILSLEDSQKEYNLRYIYDLTTIDN